MTNITIVNSHFKNNYAGVYLAIHSYSDNGNTVHNNMDTLTVRGNVFEHPSAGQSLGVEMVVGVSETAIGRNLKISENTFRFVNDTHTTSDRVDAIATYDYSENFDNITVFNNTVDPAMMMFVGDWHTNGPTAGRNPLFIANRNTHGGLNPYLNNDQTTPRKRRVITNSDTIAATDNWLIAHVSSNSTFSLPITGVPFGQTITIYNENWTSSSYTVQINCPSGTIVPTSSTSTLTLQPNETMRFTYLSGNTWMRN